MEPLRLFMVLLGCKPDGRFTEQHDVFFGVGTSLGSLVPEMLTWWPEANGKLHIDAWREVTAAGEYRISIAERQPGHDGTVSSAGDNRLFFLNLGGYKPGDFEEYHYKLLCVAGNKISAIRQAKETAFYLHTGFEGAVSHIDDKYGVDVDDIYDIEDILPASVKERYSVMISEQENAPEPEMHIGYLPVSKIGK